MLKNFVKTAQPDKEAVKAALKVEQAKLAANQMRIKEAKLPVMVIFEGWGSAGKGSVMGEVIKSIDPRFFRVATMDAEPTEEEFRIDASTFRSKGRNTPFNGRTVRGRVRMTICGGRVVYKKS